MLKPGWALVIFGAGAIGFFAGHRYGASEGIRPPGTETTSLEELRAKVRALSEQEISGLSQVTDATERTRKAEEILGKMMLILLADLGLHASSGQQLWMQNLSQAATPAPAPTATPSAPPSSAAAAAPAAPTYGETLPPATASAPLDTNWLKPEAGIKNVETAQDADAFLRRVRIRDFANQLAHSTLATDRDPRIGGCWEGDAQISRGGDKEWHVRADIFLNTEGSNSTGNSVVELFRAGKSFSRASINGKLKNLRRLPGSNTTLVLEASNRIYFQLYFIPDQDFFIGNIYRKSDVAQYDHQGVLSLYRRKPCP